MSKYILIETKDAKKTYRIDWNDLNNSFKRNDQLGSGYEISFTLTLTDQYKDVFNTAKEKYGVYYDGQWYNIQQRTPGMDENGLTTMQVTCTHTLIDFMKNVRIDTPEPTEDNPEVSGDTSSSDDSSSDDSSSDPQPGTVVKQTDIQQVASLDSYMHKFFDNNDQGISYELHGNFPQAAAEATGSLYEWITSNLKLFEAYWIPDNKVLKIYDLDSLKHQTGKQFRYMYNMTGVEIQSDVTDMVNDCEVYGGKMEKDITSGGSGTGGSLDNAVSFAESPINADFGVDKQKMISDFAANDVRVKAWSVDVNKLYDTVKGQGISPEWFFAYDLCEGNPTSWSWLNHFNNHLPDPYQDAIRVCNWIKEFANSDSFTPASYGGQGVDSATAAKWNQQFKKGTIGRLYLQGTAAAVWEVAGQNSGRYGKPLSQCINFIKSWGGHTVNNAGGGWGWPFPIGEGSFTAEQKFGSGSGWIRPGLGTDFHDGLDFGSVDHPGSEVHAVHGGTVTAGPAWGNGGINWYVVITDSSGLNVEYQEAFQNQSDIFVKTGDTVQLGQVIGRRNTSHLHIGITRASIPGAFAHAGKDDGTWLDPQAIIKSGGANIPGGDGGSGDSSTTTTTETYYALHFHYTDEESVKLYGLHRGAPIVQDSIYDMDALKKYVENNVQHMPNIALTINGINESDVALGDVWRLIAPELRLNEDVVLMGIEGNDDGFSPGGAEQTLTFNSSGLAMKDAMYAIHQDIRAINKINNQLDIYGATGARKENHFNNEGIKKDTSKQDSAPKYSQEQMNRLADYMSGKNVTLNGDK